jgi:hypothetical protein
MTTYNYLAELHKRELETVEYDAENHTVRSGVDEDLEHVKNYMGNLFCLRVWHIQTGDS